MSTGAFSSSLSLNVYSLISASSSSKLLSMSCSSPKMSGKFAFRIQKGGVRVNLQMLNEKKLSSKITRARQILVTVKELYECLLRHFSESLGFFAWCVVVIVDLDVTAERACVGRLLINRTQRRLQRGQPFLCFLAHSSSAQDSAATST